MELPEYIAALPSGPEPPGNFAGFGLERGDFRRLCASLEERGLRYEAVRASQMTAAAGDFAALPLVLWQDLPVAELAGELELLLNRILLPARLAGRPLLWLSRPEQAEYELPVRSAGLHSDPEHLWQALYLEQLRNFWEAPALQPPDPLPLYALDENLDPSQRTAVAHLLGPIRVLAPAGSGKTRTLINRIIHLLNQGIEPGEIVALAFNKKAADEMVARLQSRGIATAQRLHQPGVVVRTFHGFGYEIIRRALGWSYDGRSEQEKLRQLMQQAVAPHHQLKQRRNQDALEPFLAALSHAKMDLLLEEQMTAETEEGSVPFAPIFGEFLKLQKKSHFCNFDDMIYLTLVLLLERPGLRQELQQRFHFVLVDEFQDLNAAQILLMNLLALPQNNLFVVGDDDQMIYGWRGADVRHILDFTRRYGGAVDCTLTTNYRSAQAIVRHAGWLIGHNRHRVAKPMGTPPAAAPGSVEFKNCSSLWEQAREAAGWISAHQAAGGGEWHDFAILFRYHAYKYIAAILLDAAGVPHTPVDGSSLAQTAAGRDLHAWLALILKGEAAPVEALRRTLKRPNRFFPNHFINGITTEEDLAYAAESEEVEDWLRQALQTFLGDLHYLRELIARKQKPDAYLAHMSMIIGLQDFYKQQKRPYMALDEAGLEVLLDVLISVAGSFSSIRDFFNALDRALTAPALTAPAPPAPVAEQDGVILSTIHAAKGREFRYVVLYQFNGPGSCPEEEMEEERRVAYVGATRAAAGVLALGPASAPGQFMRELAFNPLFAGESSRSLTRKIERTSRERAQARTPAPAPERLQQALEEELALRQALGWTKP
ncbi:MAG TPA: ATP-dependent helicase [bacterium]|nr:ATP-dependent helicase [bacterium]HPR88459.1 ATP-dependent helicase [bacterium]